MESRTLSSYRWVVLLVSCLIIFIADYIQFQLSALATEIMPALGIDVAQFSALLLAPLLAGVFVSIPGGSLADKFGAKIVVGVATAISVVLAFGRLVAGDFTVMLIMMLGTGIAPSVLQAATIKLFGAWFEDKMDFAMGIYFAAACCGIAAGLATSAFFPSVQDAYLWSSIAFAAILVLWFVLAKNQPKGAEVPPSEPVMQYFGVAIKTSSCGSSPSRRAWAWPPPRTTPAFCRRLWLKCAAWTSWLPTTWRRSSPSCPSSAPSSARCGASAPASRASCWLSSACLAAS